MRPYVRAVYGPPGCGKTTALVALAREGRTLIPGSTLFLSFTRAAAIEIGLRAGEASGRAQTIHSLAYAICGIDSHQVVTDKKLEEFGRLTRWRIPLRRDLDDIFTVGPDYLQLESIARNKLIPIESVNSSSDFLSFCQHYTEWKLNNGYFDFNDMLEDAATANDWSWDVAGPVERVYLDEAQDVTPLQWKFFTRLIERLTPREITVAGDDDQTLYTWSGVNPQGMYQFEQRWGADRMVLSQSYRVPRLAHRIAHKLLKRVHERVEKEYHPRPVDGGFRRFGDPYRCLRAIPKGKRTFILTRTFVQKRLMEQILSAHNVPFETFAGNSPFTNKWSQIVRRFYLQLRGEELPLYQRNTLAIHSYKEDVAQKFVNKIPVEGNWWSHIDIPEPYRSYLRRLSEDELNVLPDITISTIHAAKGREADHVVLCTGLTQRTIEAMNDDPAAEARVFYVGVTRTKDTLDILDIDQPYPVPSP